MPVKNCIVRYPITGISCLADQDRYRYSAEAIEQVLEGIPSMLMLLVLDGILYELPEASVIGVQPHLVLAR